MNREKRLPLRTILAVAIIIGGFLLINSSLPYSWWQQQWNFYPFANNREAIAQGGSLYGKWCLKCHPPGYPGILRKHANHLVLKPDFFRAITDGNQAGGMPSFKDQLSRDQRWKIITYIRNDEEDMRQSGENGKFNKSN